MTQDHHKKTLSPKVAGQIFSHNGKGFVSQKNEWRIAREMPLVLFYNSEQLGVMMITPSDIEDFCIGFSITESIVKSASDIADIRLEEIGDGIIANIIVPEEALKIARERKRTVKGGSSCGICGAQTLEAVLPVAQKTSGFIAEPEAAMNALKSISKQQRQNRENFSTHAAALANETGEIILLREDIGRHNALDKLCGAMTQNSLGAKDGFLVLTSRFSLEMAQKAATAGFSYVATISAPTALALKTAEQASMIVATLSRNELMVFGSN